MFRTASRCLAACLTLNLAIAPAAAAATSPGPIAAAAARAVQRVAADEPALWRSLIEKLEPGVLVAVRTKDGARTIGTVMRAEEETFTFKPRTRIPVAAYDIAYRDVTLIERHRLGMSPGRKTLIGVGIGAGSIMVIGLLMVAAYYD